MEFPLPFLGGAGRSAHVSRTWKGKEERSGNPKRNLKKNLLVKLFIYFVFCCFSVISVTNLAVFQNANIEIRNKSEIRMIKLLEQTRFIQFLVLKFGHLKLFRI